MLERSAMRSSSSCENSPLAARLGQTARERVRALFLNDRHFMRWVEVLGSALQQRAAAAR